MACGSGRYFNERSKERAKLEREHIKLLILSNPNLSLKDIADEMHVAYNRISRFYMSVRREILIQHLEK